MLTKIGNDEGDETTKAIKTAHGKLSASVDLGQYTVSVEGNSRAAAQLIKLNSHKTLRYEINPINTTAPEPVADQSAQDIAASGSRLVYLDSDALTQNTIDADNNLTTPDPSQKFQTIKWANASYGVGQDSNQNLYVIDDQLISPLPFPYDSGGAINFDVAPNKQIYVSSGANIYVGSQDGNFKKIYTAPSSNFTLGTTANKIAVSYEVGGKNGDDSGKLVVINDSGKIVKEGPGGEAGSLVWSPSGQYLASVNESSIAVYDSSLHQVATIPVSFRAGYLVWLNNDKLFFNSFFTSSDQLWSYDLGKQRADLVASVALDNTITGLNISDDGSYVYIGTVDSTNNNSPEILRVGLRGQQVPVILYQLQDILPMTLSDSTISLINFAQPPAILVQPLQGAGSSPQTYLQEAQTELNQDGFNSNSLRFNLAQGD